MRKYKLKLNFLNKKKYIGIFKICIKKIRGVSQTFNSLEIVYEGLSHFEITKEKLKI